PRPPDHVDAIAGLQYGLHAPRTATANETEMTAMRQRHRLKNEAGLAMPARADDDGFILPLHGRILPLSLRKIESDLAVAFRIIAPVLAHFHIEKQMHLEAQLVSDLLARGGTDGADGLALVAEHDLFLALALDIDH